MSLPVPLTVRVGDRHITRQVQSLSFRREAIGGVRSISFTLARSLTDLNGLDPLAKVYVYDARNATTVAEGRLTDAGRGADGDGQRWDCVAFGPAQHASDIKTPLVYIDRSLDGWRFFGTESANSGGSFASSQQPNTTTDLTGLLAAWSDGAPVVTNSMVAMRYDRVREAGMKLAWLSYDWGTGVTSAPWLIEASYSTDGNPAAADLGTPDAFNTAGGTRSATVVTNFANGRNVVDLRARWTGGATTVAGDTTWAFVRVPRVEALRVDKSGTEVTGTYASGPSSHHIVEDLLGRLLPEFDGANATVDTAGSVSVAQMVYPAAVTPAQVLDDLMALQPAYRWTTTPDTAGDGYGFRWEAWPTTVRYEATLDDGGSFPLSSQAVYNRVIVQWLDDAGYTRITLRTLACPVLDDQGLIRQEVITLGSEVGSQAQAEAAGDAFLDAHNVPKNAGTLTVARPIRDVTTGTWVQPWEIEPGELVRILGVEAYPDAFNADTNDGQGVFRIHAVDYTSEGNTATLALDADARGTEDALVKLLNQRSRR